MRSCCRVLFGAELSRDWPDPSSPAAFSGRGRPSSIRGSHEQSLRTGNIAQTRIEGDDSCRFDVESGRQMQRVKSTERRRERHHQPLGTAMDRRRQLGPMRGREFSRLRGPGVLANAAARTPLRRRAGAVDPQNSIVWCTLTSKRIPIEGASTSDDRTWQPTPVGVHRTAVECAQATDGVSGSNTLRPQVRAPGSPEAWPLPSEARTRATRPSSWRSCRV